MMHDYYITICGWFIRTSYYLGQFECIEDAEKAALACTDYHMDCGDQLLEFPVNIDPMIHLWSHPYADPELATDIVSLWRTQDDDGVPDDKWYWDGDNVIDTIYYNADGTEWNGRMEA